MENTDPKEKQSQPVESNNQVVTKDGQNIENEKDVHEIEAGNVGETEAKKDLLDGPANDLIGMPGGDDED